MSLRSSGTKVWTCPDDDGGQERQIFDTGFDLKIDIPVNTQVSTVTVEHSDSRPATSPLGLQLRQLNKLCLDDTPSLPYIHVPQNVQGQTRKTEGGKPKLQYLKVEKYPDSENRDVDSTPTPVEQHSMPYACRLKPVGPVSHGNAKDLTNMVKTWGNAHHGMETGTEGILLDPELTPWNGYNEGEHWSRKEFLGAGTFGKCHLAEDIATGKEFCVKEVPISKFEADEVIIWSHLNHRHIVQLLGAIRTADTVFIFSEYIDGCTLETFIESLDHTDTRTIARMLAQLCEVLVYLKRQRTLHEDIKAANIMVRLDGGDLLMLDFGLAKRLDDIEYVKSNSPVGTQTHWSPEKATCQAYGYKSDLWSVICVAIHMLSGSPPWKDRFPDAAVLNFIIWKYAPPIEDIPSHTDPALRELLMRGFSIKESERASAEELVEEFWKLAIPEMASFDFCQDVDTMDGDSEMVEGTNYANYPEMLQSYVMVEKPSIDSFQKLNGSCYSIQPMDE